MRRWATQGLKAGDLTALSRIRKNGASYEPERTQRLVRRKFARRKGNGSYAVTLAGRTALAIKCLCVRW